MSKVLKERIENIEKIAKSIYKMTVKSEYISKNAVRGSL
ncbi:dihydroorotate dehydrogenase electron transfer subunit [Acetivibrio straminisolvens JCM 21531]|uniref:Dihydroorotate dehydrogenase electron transfer subunit n=1 Tax=Acetivibrio straminisolvens JCM 21531 TaxID=1294263 RepID=W4V717_9FIRM|nr:dihydroorotate dehydrogenase electron transfer subunit [Acetivibrio straminisolvens JCM 21531]